jgi:hypothetical protein
MGKGVTSMVYTSPKLEVVEEFERGEPFYAPKIAWLSLVACVLITVGQTLSQ